MSFKNQSLAYLLRLTTPFAAMVIFAVAHQASGQTASLLNINDSTYPSTCSVSNYQALGIPGLSGSETISQFSPSFNASLTSPMIFTNGGQVLYLDIITNGGAWTKPTGAGSTNGLMDCYLYTTMTTPRTITVSNLNLVPGTNYILYLIGTIPVSDTVEDGLFQPLNSTNITFGSTLPGHGIVGFPFTTAATYSNENSLQFTWAKAFSGNGTFQGLAIIPGLPPSPTQSLTISNGIQKYALIANTSVNMSGACELWVTNSILPISGCVINLNSPDSWLFLPNIKPSIVTASLYLGQLRINGTAAVPDTNCRVVQFGASGTIVIPQSSGFQPLTVFSQPQFGGVATSYNQWTYYTGGGIGNFSSFRLKRGYQAVFAQSVDGRNWSKCYTAQDEDLEVGALPPTLDKQVQFLFVTPWRWTTKKGSCDIAPGDLDARWWYNWIINSNSTRDMEYVAIRQQPYWPSLSQGWQALRVNHVSGFNEPDNPTQDAYRNLNPPGSVTDAVTRLPNQLATGLRVGGPAVTDGGYSWIVDFVNQAEAAGYRIDYLPVHYYRSYPDNNYPQGAAGNLYTFLKGLHDAVKKPIWLTEFNNGANWTTDPDPTFDQNKNVIQAMINMMDSTPWVERYSIYSAVEEVRQIYYNTGGYTPMGLMYRDHQAPLGYLQVVPDNGMRGIAQYLFRTNAYDTSGYYNNGMVTGSPAYATGHNAQSQAIVLDGANNYVLLPAAVAKGSGFTFAGWVYWNGGGNWQRIFDFGNDTTQYLFLTPSSGGGTLRFAINGGNGEQILERPGALVAGLWQHVAVTLTGSNATLYVNGSQVVASTGFSTAPSNFNPQANYLGKSQFPADPLFNGKLDDVEIADYAMSAAQISALYNNSLNPTYTSGVWSTNADGYWSTTNNWSSGVIPNGSGRIADFSTINLTADRTITLDSARTIGGLRFGDTSGSQNWFLIGANKLTLDGGGTNPATVAVNQNTANVSIPLAGSFGFTKSGSGTLTLSGSNSLGGGLTVTAGSVNIIAGNTGFGVGVSTIGNLTGTGNLSMTGGSLAIGGELRVGGSDQAGSKYIASGTMNLSNATLLAGSLTIARGSYLDNAISGSVTLESGATLVSTNDAILEFAGKGLGKLVVNGGTLVIGPSATKWLMIGYYDSGAGELDLTNGNILLENGTSIKMCRAGNTGTNIVNQVGGNITFYSDAGGTIGGGGNLDLSYAGGANSSSIYNLNGGMLTVPQIVSASSVGRRSFNFNGGTLRAAVANQSFFGAGVAGSANVRNLGAIIDDSGFSVGFAQGLQHSTIVGDNPMDGGLIKSGNGVLTLSGTNTYTGKTLIKEGTLALGTGGSIDNSSSIVLSNNAIFDVSAVNYILPVGRTLMGDGSVVGAVTINGTLAPGSTIGTLTFSTPPTLNGTTVMEINRTNAHNSDRMVLSNGTLVYGGGLTVNNTGPALQAGDSFQLFQAGAIGGSFASLNLPPLAPNLGWNTNNLSSGILSIIQAVAMNPTNILYVFGNESFSLSWPQDHTGWRLQVQTNRLATGLTTNWIDMAGATATNAVTLPVDRNNGSVFFRLVYP